MAITIDDREGLAETSSANIKSLLKPDSPAPLNANHDTACTHASAASASQRSRSLL